MTVPPRCYRPHHRSHRRLLLQHDRPGSPCEMHAVLRPPIKCFCPTRPGEMQCAQQRPLKGLMENISKLIEIICPYNSSEPYCRSTGPVWPMGPMGPTGPMGPRRTDGERTAGGRRRTTGSGRRADRRNTGTPEHRHMNRNKNIGIWIRCILCKF